eukprot:2153238-Pleurochrysis_carterae.AAC.1
MAGSRKRGSAARCSGRSVVEDGVDAKAGAAAGGTGGAAGDEAGAPVSWRSKWWRCTPISKTGGGSGSHPSSSS